jgi:hypothetical protein
VVTVVLGLAAMVEDWRRGGRRRAEAMAGDPISLGAFAGFVVFVVVFARWRRARFRSYLVSHPTGRFRVVRAWAVSAAPLVAVLVVLLAAEWAR